MRHAHRSYVVRTAAAVALFPFLTVAGVAGQPSDASDDLYLNACSSAGCNPGSGNTKAPTQKVKISKGNNVVVATAPSAPKSEPQIPACWVSASDAAVVKPVPEAGDDLFLNLVAPLEPLAGAGDSLGVKVVESLEVVPAPNTIAPLTESRNLSATPAGTGLNRPIVSLTLDAAADPELVDNLSRLKTDVAIKDESIDRFGSWSSPTSEASSAPARFTPQQLSWAAPAVYTNPLYFEQPNVERYGHYVGVCDGDNLTQSAISAAHFFVAVPALPYKIGAESPTECNYVLGAYRPGSCNPHQLVKPPLSLRGLVYEGAAATGLVFFLP